MNSKNSSKPPSTDPNRSKKPRTASTRKPGGQQGHNGKTLQQVCDPDEIKVIKVDRSVLPQGHYRERGYEVRQVIDLDISKVVTEYRAQILEDKQGKRYVAPFSDGITRPVLCNMGLGSSSILSICHSFN